ncbi:MFS transporter (plasmid) [Paracoccus methylovorus]|uniref:MFS transporter n=2 Tax=Paracoccus methylovorus TaxID=2812658 RepID=A0ABX7JPY4_9RHOB|nr:MFS transporter [Paracoccus methylovorus]
MMKDSAQSPIGPQQARPGTFNALRYRNYRLYWLGNFVSFTGDWLDQIALNWLVITTTGDPVMLGLVNLGRGLPILLFAILGGVVADRIDRRRMLITTQAAAMMVAIGLALTVALYDSAIWLIMILATCRGTIVAFNQPARQSLIYQLVPREAMTSAISMNSITINMAKIIGPLASAAIIATLGITACFIANAVSFTVVMATLMLMDLPAQGIVREKEPFLATLTGGISYLRREPILLMLVAVALVPTFFCLPYLQFLAVFAAHVFDVGAAGFGTMTAIAAAGSIFGALLSAHLQHDARRGSTMLLFMGGFGVALVAFSLAPSFYAAAPILFIAGAMHIAYNSSNATILQLTVDDAYRGRVLSTLFMSRGLRPLGMATMSLLSVWIGPRLAMGLMATVVVVFAGVVWMFMPRLRNLTI